MLRKSILSKSSFATATAATTAKPSVSYSRKGDQVPSALIPVKNVSKLSSGLTVATIDQMGPLSSLALVINAGSRNESQNALGVAHFWKNSLIRTIPGSTVVKTIRENELRGDTLYSAVSREHILLASDFLRDDLVDVVPEMVQNLLNKNMEVYEFLDTRSQVIEESNSALSDPTTLLIENLHSAAFRNGLGNPLFATQGNTENLKRSSLFEFAAQHFTTDRIAIIGRDVNHKDLVTLVEQAFELFPKTSGQSTANTTKYFGGERRVDTGTSSSSEYILAFPSVSIQSAQYPAALVLTALLDGQKRTKWSPNATGLLGKVAHASNASSVQAFNTSYSDAGLFGVHVSAKNASSVKPAVQGFIDTLKSISQQQVSESELLRAKKSALLHLENQHLTSLRHPTSMLNLATSLFSAPKSMLDIQSLNESVMKVSWNEVGQLVKGLGSAQPSVSSIGPASLPYLDEFKF